MDRREGVVLHMEVGVKGHPASWIRLREVHP